MRFSATLGRYLGRHFLLSFLAVFLLLSTVAFVVDFVELLRRSASKANVTFGLVLDMSLLKLPFLASHMVVFSVLFGAMIAFFRLSRSREILVVRAAGLSAWQFLAPILALAFLVGVVKVAVLNPIAAATLSKFEQIESKYLRGRSSVMAVSASGVWLRQADLQGQSVVHARQVSSRDMEMYDFIIFLYDLQGRFTGRIDAAKARLENGYWHLYDAWLTGPDRPASHEREYTVRTELTVAKIQESFAAPESVAVWDLPRFIRVLERAGFSAVRHRIYFNTLIADPVLMCAMVLFAATFSLGHNPRRGGSTLVAAGALATVVVLYFLSDVVRALGTSANIPVVLAAWTPAGASTLIGMSMLLYAEER